MTGAIEGRLKARLGRLVGLNTENPPGREIEAARFVADELAACGCEVHVDGFDAERANIVAVLQNGEGPTLAFNSHLDVVPAGEGWSRDPFVLVEDGGRLFGRGACDAKGPIVAMIEAVAMLANNRRAWAGTLVAVFVADEEVGSRGARRFASELPGIDFVVVGEPTGNAPVIAHKGSLRPIVRVEGRMAHSGTPDLGVNAILGAARVLDRVAAAHREISLRRHPLVGSASLTVTRISGGVADNIVPDACEMMLDRRMIPGEREADAIGEIQALLRAVETEDGVHAMIVRFQETTGGATETAAGHPIVLAALAACRANGVTGAKLGGFGGGCDLVHFREIGAQGVVVGPGDLALAHKPDEFVPVAELAQSAFIYRDIALQMLAPASEGRS